jgi:hypothetical protein
LIRGALGKATDPFTWLGKLAASLIRPVFEAFGKVVFATPDVSSNPSVRTMWLALLALTDACMVAIVVFRANQVSWGGLFQRIRSKRGLEGVFIGAAAAQLHLLVLWPLIAFTNALTAALLKVGGDNLQVRLDSLIPVMLGPAGPVFDPLWALIVLAAAVTAFLVVFWAIVRVLVLAVVTVLGPPANMALALEQDELTRAWWRAQVILLFTPALQVVVCDLALWLFFGSEPLFRGVPDFVNGMLVLVLLWCLCQIPKMALRAPAAPLMAAYAQARGKVKVALGLAAIGVGLPIGLRSGFSAGGLMRGLIAQHRGKSLSAKRRRSGRGRSQPSKARP